MSPGAFSSSTRAMRRDRHRALLVKSVVRPAEQLARNTVTEQLVIHQ